MKESVTGLALALILTGCSQIAAQDTHSRFEGHGVDYDVMSARKVNATPDDAGRVRVSAGIIEDIEVGRRSLIPVGEGDTLLAVLARAGAKNDFYYSLSRSEQQRLARMYPGDLLDIRVDADRQVQRFGKRIDGSRWLVVVREAGEYAVSEQVVVSQYAEERVSGAVGDDLRQALKAARIPPSIQQSYLAMFGPRIDADKGRTPGDRFGLIYRQRFMGGEPLGPPEIRSAYYRRNARNWYAFLYETTEGVKGYYDDQGVLLVNDWLREPVESVTRISSHFSLGRRHPVTGRVRAHRGVDFASPRGTPVYAASNGRITYAGRNGGYGNYVRIRHPNGIETRYGHLYRIRKDLGYGDHVQTGEVIGYVGSTGLSTGSHLHYEVRVDGQAVDPLKIDFTRLAALKGEERQRFMQARQAMRDRMRNGHDYIAMYAYPPD